jgi:hypothetical protein
MSEKWIEEEELLEKLISNEHYEPISLENILVQFVYVNYQHEIVGKTSASLNTANRSVAFSRVDWPELVSLADSYSHNGEVKYEMGDVGMFHITRDHDHINAESWPTTLTPVSETDTKISSTVEVFHDLSELIVIMRPTSPKSILKSGNSTAGGATKRVRINVIRLRKTRRKHN